VLPQVDTAVISPYVGGAVARPFVTHSSAINANMYLRISPELYLKVRFEYGVPHSVSMILSRSLLVCLVE
jgi:lysyl-tRNA synthetase class II